MNDGGWIKRRKDEHVCPKPELDEVPDVSPGDVWQCSRCGMQWKVHEHQIDGLYWLMAEGWKVNG